MRRIKAVRFMSAFQARLLLIDEQAQRAFFNACTSEKAELIAALAKSIDECPKVLNAEPHALDAQQTLAAVLKGCDRSDRWSLADRFPAYPPKLRLVSPQAVGRRRLGSERGRAAMLHAIAHIEWHAIHLAIDAAMRFTHMPLAYCFDWLGVAVDEARHFAMLERHLKQHYGVCYGDFPAHAGMWDMAVQTQTDVLARMALVPRVLEARGLDVTPAMIEGLERHGDRDAAACLRIILAEEVRHVWLGTYWFRQVCSDRGLDPQEQFVHSLKRFRVARSKALMNLAARREAGFSDFELDQLASLAQTGAGKNSTGVIN